MKINVYFGKGNGVCLDDRKPLEQVKLVKKFIKEGRDFDIVTCSPYIIEAVDTYKKDAEVEYFNDGKESDISPILSEINEAFYVMEEYRFEK
jgi:hypothetical protein